MKRIIAVFWAILLVLTSVCAGISFAEANEFPYLELHVAYFNRTNDGQADAVVTIAFRRGSGGYAQSCVEDLTARVTVTNGLSADRELYEFGDCSGPTQFQVHLTCTAPDAGVDPERKEEDRPALQIHVSSLNCGEADYLCQFDEEDGHKLVVAGEEAYSHTLPRYVILQVQDEETGEELSDVEITLDTGDGKTRGGVTDRRGIWEKVLSVNGSTCLLFRKEDYSDEERVLGTDGAFFVYMRRNTVAGNGRRYVTANGATYFWRQNEESVAKKNPLEKYIRSDQFYRSARKELVRLEKEGTLQTLCQDEPSDDRLYIADNHLFYMIKGNVVIRDRDGGGGQSYPCRSILGIDDQSGLPILLQDQGTGQMLSKINGEGKIEELMAVSPEMTYYGIVRGELYGSEHQPGSILIHALNLQTHTDRILSEIPRNGEEYISTSQLEEDSLYLSVFASSGGNGATLLPGGLYQVSLKDGAVTALLDPTKGLAADDKFIVTKSSDQDGRLVYFLYAENGSSAFSFSYPYWTTSQVRVLDTKTAQIHDSDLPLSPKNGYVVLNDMLMARIKNEPQYTVIVSPEEFARNGYENLNPDPPYRKDTFKCAAQVELVGQTAFFDVWEYDVNLRYVEFTWKCTKVWKVDLSTGQMEYVYGFGNEGTDLSAVQATVQASDGGAEPVTAPPARETEPPAEPEPVDSFSELDDTGEDTDPFLT
ncbi:MAG: hypothetical protein II719_04180, partial [Clostridia bacterium]|nr:hypothetical protein [Clostridia bacterium]